MSRPGSRRSYLAALGAGIAVIAASTYGVSLTRAAQDISSVDAPSAITASAVVSAPTPAGSMPPSTAPSSTAPPSPAPSSTAPPASSAPAASSPDQSSAQEPTRSSSSRTAAAGSRPPAPGASSSPTTRSPVPSTSSAAPAPSSSSPAPASSSAAPAPAATQFKDGTYSATAQYNSPGGVEQVGVTVMLAGDVVTGSSLQLFGTGIAKSYQNLFQRSYAPQVTGKKIDTIKLSAVGGSSLTSGGFNAALQAIEAQARA